MPARDGFEITDGDLELLHFVHQFRLAHIDHLAVLSGRSTKALGARLLNACGPGSIFPSCSIRSHAEIRSGLHQGL